MPPKTSTKPDDLIDALTDPRVIEALAKALSPTIRLTIEETLNARLAGLVASVGDLKRETAQLQERNKQLETKNKVLSDRLTALEQYSRQDNLIIRGLPEQSMAERATSSPDVHDSSTLADTHQSVEESVLKLCRETLGISIEPRDISVAHRLKPGSKDRFRPVIVKFATRRIRNMVYQAKKHLRGTPENRSSNGIYISEHLTKETADLFFEARKMVKEKRIFAAWTQNCQVHIRMSADPTSRAIIVKNRADLTIRH